MSVSKGLRRLYRDAFGHNFEWTWDCVWGHIIVRGTLGVVMLAFFVAFTLMCLLTPIFIIYMFDGSDEAWVTLIGIPIFWGGFAGIVHAMKNGGHGW